MNTLKVLKTGITILSTPCNKQILKVVPLKLRIPTLSGNRFIDLIDILYCRANGSYTIIHTKNNEKIIVSKVLKWIENRLLTDQFIRVHHSYIVNRETIVQFHFAVQSWVAMIDGTTIPIARSRKKHVKSILM